VHTKKRSLSQGGARRCCSKFKKEEGGEQESKDSETKTGSGGCARHLVHVEHQLRAQKARKRCAPRRGVSAKEELADAAASSKKMRGEIEKRLEGGDGSNLCGDGSNLIAGRESGEKNTNNGLTKVFLTLQPFICLLCGFVPVVANDC
jgi:hypothetical protein